MDAITPTGDDGAQQASETRAAHPQSHHQEAPRHDATPRIHRRRPGTTGLQIHERLQGRDDLRLLTLPAAEREGRRAPPGAINACDIAILCLPDEPARRGGGVHPQSQGAGDRRQFRASHHRGLGLWLSRNDARPGRTHRRRVAGGCFRPAPSPCCARWSRPACCRPTIRGAGGVGLFGRQRTPTREPDAAAQPFQVCGLGLARKHTPEIQRHAGLTQRPVFLPYGAFRQGIVLTVPLATAAAGADLAALQACLAERYAGSRHGRVAGGIGGAGAEPQALNGTNDLRLSVHGNAAEDRRWPPVRQPGQASGAAVQTGSDAGAALKKRLVRCCGSDGRGRAG